MAEDVDAPAPGQRLTTEYVRFLARLAYLWGWPLVNVHNRLRLMAMLPEPGLVGGIVPGGPPGSLGMLNDYIQPQQRVVACPNQDVAYGCGVIDARQGPSVIQVPDFGDRFWVYQVVNQRTDAFTRLGAMYDTAPGMYLLAPTGWDGAVPDGITEVFRFDTRIAVALPRVFMDDTDADRAALRDVVNQIDMYPLSDYTGTPRLRDWAGVPTFPTPADSTSEEETQWVDPTTYFDQLRDVLDEVPPLPGEQAVYGWVTSLLDALDADAELADIARSEAVAADEGLVRNLFEFRNIGIPVGDHWATQRNAARFGTDYLSRTGIAKAAIFANLVSETTYFFQDVDADGQRLHGSTSYEITFPPGAVPPVRGFWSLTVYNEHHFFHPNDLDRYSLGTKTKNLHYNDDGSLTLTGGGPEPTDPDQRANWLSAPDGPFSLFIRAYWPEQPILDGTWTPPPVRPRT
jgi:hypothetical protein